LSGKVRIGVVGLGGRGVYLGYRAFAKNPRAELVAACDSDKAKLDAVRQKFGDGPKLYDNLDAMLADPNVEAVVVATPDHAHSQNNNEQEFRIRVTYRHTKRADDYFPPKMPGGHGGGDPRIQEEFLDRVLSGQPSMSGALDARNSAAIAIAANQSIETRSPVEIPPYAPKRP